jgi:hypothetical protein
MKGNNIKCAMDEEEIKDARTNQKFCSDRCRSAYHRLKKQDRFKMLDEINSILRKKYIILLELLESNKDSVSEEYLNAMEFNFDFHTSYTIQDEYKRIIYYIYDIAYFKTFEKEYAIRRNHNRK